MESATTRSISEPTTPPLAEAEEQSSTLSADSLHSSEAETDSPDAEGNHVTHVPPYWHGGGVHGRSTSYHSIGRQRPAPILLEDHTEDDNDLSQSCWAKSATIDEGVLISGATGIGAYVVWHCTVKTLKGGDMTIRKR